MVAALRARNHNVEYLLFADEGHGLNLTTNRIEFMRAVERFLARHIGGRDGGDGADPAGAAGPDAQTERADGGSPCPRQCRRPAPSHRAKPPTG